MQDHGDEDDDVENDGDECVQRDALKGVDGMETRRAEVEEKTTKVGVSE